jgi:hypothetical protein
MKGNSYDSRQVKPQERAKAERVKSKEVRENGKAKQT